MPIDLEYVLNNGGSIRITKCQLGSIREESVAEKPLRLEVDLPSGWKSKNNGYSAVTMIFPFDANFLDALLRVNGDVHKVAVPPAGSA